MFQRGESKEVKESRAAKDQETEPERIYKLKECCDMLLAGGYFRARISALSPFDRVVGGMVWSITASNVDVDVDIIFQENSTIGEKIKLSESIVRALLKMKCPIPVQSHQIQGLDYDHLFPVIQWLVRSVIETRALTGDLVRQQSVSQFSKHYQLPQDLRPPSAREYVTSLLHDYRPQRKFKRRSDADFPTPAAKIEATLLEYDEHLYRADADIEETDEKKASAQFAKKRSALAAKFESTPQISDEERKQQEEAVKKQKHEEEAQRVADLKSKLDVVDPQTHDAKVSVGGMLDMDAIARHNDELKRHEAEQETMDKSVAPGKRGLAQQFTRQIDTLKRRITEQEATLIQARSVYEEKMRNADTLKQELDQKAAYNERVVEETGKLEIVEKEHANAALLPQLKALVILNESLKSQEAQFKANCKTQLSELKEMMAKLDSDDSDEETKRLLEIERLYDADLAKIDKLRQVLAKKNQEISKIVRAIDDIPTRAELIQYERRFVELYELVADKLVETRKYYDLYNTLEETHRFMTNEVSLLESIGQNFPVAIKTSGGKDQFLESFRGILQGVEQSEAHVQGELQSQLTEREKLNDKHKKLLEKQRKYFKAVKEFQEECFKNEKLSEALSQRAQIGTPVERSDE